MNKVLFSSILAGFLAVAAVADAKEVIAKVTVGKKTFGGMILGRTGDLINFRPAGGTGTVSWPADAIKEAEFPIKLDKHMVDDLYEKRLYDELIPMLVSAIQPFEEYNDLPSNLAESEGMLMELFYKTGDYEKALKYAAMLSSDNRDPDLQRKSLIYQGLSLIEEDRFDEAEQLFSKQGWTEQLSDDAPAEDLYITAKFLAMKGEYSKAIEVAAKVVVFDSQDPDWMRPAELLCAEMYTELGMLDSADEVIREITLLYKNTDEADQAQKLKERVAKLREEQDKSDEE